MPNPLTSLIIVNSFTMKTHLCRGEFFPNGINRSICKKYCAPSFSHRNCLRAQQGQESNESKRAQWQKQRALFSGLDPAKTFQLFSLLSVSTNLAGKNGETPWELLLQVQVFPSPCPTFLGGTPTELLPFPASHHQATWIGDSSQLSELKWQAEASNHAPKCPVFSAITSILLIKLSFHCS